MPTDVVLAGVKSARLGRGIAGFSGEGGHGCCTKQACVSSEWMALSQALADKFWALQNQTPLPRSWASLSGEAGGVAIVPGPEAPRPGLCPAGPRLLRAQEISPKALATSSSLLASPGPGGDAVPPRARDKAQAPDWIPRHRGGRPAGAGVGRAAPERVLGPRAT